MAKKFHAGQNIDL